MMGNLQFKQLPKGLVIAGACIMLIVILSACAWLFEKPQMTNALASTAVPSDNLFAQIAQMNRTTDQMLANTEALNTQVQQVQGKLGELSAQEQILQKQTQTGQQLAQALSTQEQLTATGVALMGQILEREKQSVQVTTHLSQQADQLSQGVAQNATTLKQLAGPLNTSAQESEVLNGQMDQLLAELRTSQDTFKLFGTLDDILRNPLDLQGTISKIENSMLPPAVKDALLKMLPKVPGAPSLPVVPGVPILPGGNGASGGSAGGGVLGGGGLLGGILH